VGARPNAGVSTDTIYSKARLLSKTPRRPQDGRRCGGSVVRQGGHRQLRDAIPRPRADGTDEHDRRRACDSVTLYTPTQAQTDSQKTAAKITGLPLESVKVVTTFAGGGFGRRGENRLHRRCVYVSKAAGIPIKLIWTREDDIRNDPYRGGTVSSMSAALTPDGKVTTLKHTMVSSSIVARAIPFLMKNGVDPLAVTHDTLRSEPLVAGISSTLRSRLGSGRAPYANSNTFATESTPFFMRNGIARATIDELTIVCLSVVTLRRALRRRHRTHRTAAIGIVADIVFARPDQLDRDAGGFRNIDASSMKSSSPRRPKPPPANVVTTLTDSSGRR